MQPTKYYGVLYIDQVHNRNANLAGRQDPVDIYLSCACLCAKTFRSVGESFFLVTNDVRGVQRRLQDLELNGPTVVGFEFCLPVPQGVPFYAAHFKLELFRGFGSGEFGNDVGFVDLDTVLLRRLPKCDALGVYDISDQVLPVYEQSRIVADIKKVSGKLIPEARWYGGEFVVGSASDFRAISHYIEKFWDSYIENLSSLVHVGDEMIMSSALNVARLDGLALDDYGKNGLVSRWWSTRTLHRQPPFDSVKCSALLHLPADKKFLAKEAQRGLEGGAFLEKFRPYARRKCLLRRIIHVSEALLREPRQFSPELTGSGISHE